jgi:hypothetical protein
MTAPQILEASQAQRAYWQVIAPHDQHLVSRPPGLTADMQWRRQGFWFGRTGSLPHHDLQGWIGASEQPDLPRGANVYLFSAFASPVECAVRLVERPVVILVCSGIALLVGLGVIYLPLARHSVTLLLTGIAIVGAGFWMADLAILAGQAAMAGVVCALVARLLATQLQPRAPRQLALRDSAPSSVAIRSTQPQMRYEGSSHATTAAAPLALAAPPAEPLS